MRVLWGGQGSPSLLPPPRKMKKHQRVRSTMFPWRWRLCKDVCKGELLGGKGLASEVGGSGPSWCGGCGVSSSLAFLALWVPKAALALALPGPSRGGEEEKVGEGMDGVGSRKGLHSPPSSSTNVDEVASQGSREAHFLFRPQDFPRQAPPGRGRGSRSLRGCGRGCGPLGALPAYCDQGCLEKPTSDLPLPAGQKTGNGVQRGEGGIGEGPGVDTVAGSLLEAGTEQPQSSTSKPLVRERQCLREKGGLVKGRRP